MTYPGTPRKPKVGPTVPTFEIDRIMGNVHVGTPAAEVEQMIRDRIDQALTRDQAEYWTPAVQRQTIRYALWRHARNLAECRWVMGPH